MSWLPISAERTPKKIWLQRFHQKIATGDAAGPRNCYRRYRHGHPSQHKALVPGAKLGSPKKEIEMPKTTSPQTFRSSEEWEWILCGIISGREILLKRSKFRDRTLSGPLSNTHFLRNVKALTADFPDVPSLKELGCFSFCVQHAGSCDSGATKQQKL